MVAYPVHGSSPWDGPLKAYIDAQVTMGFLDPLIAAAIEDSGSDTFAALTAFIAAYEAGTLDDSVAALVDDEDSNVYASLIALISSIVTTDGPFFLPKTYGAVGYPSVVDNHDALQACFDAAYAVGGTVLIDDHYTCAGELIHRGGIIVQGLGGDKVLVSPDGKIPGITALDSTFRYRYGNWSTANSADDNPGALRDLVIDGDDVGGADDGLLIMQCVDGFVGNCTVLRSAGNGILFDGTQNSVVLGGLNGYHAGRGLDFSRIDDEGQGAANVRIYGMYQGSSTVGLYSSSDPANFWPHDIYIDCLMETYVDGTDLVHLTAGDFHMTNPLITNSNAVPTGNDCLILIENIAWPTVGTVLTLHSPILNGGGGGGVTDLIRIKNAGTDAPNTVIVDGHAQWNNADNIYCIDGGGVVNSGRVHDRSEGVKISGTLNTFRVNGTGYLYYCRNEVGIPQRLMMPDDVSGTLQHPLGIGHEDDTYTRRSWSRDGDDYWLDPDTNAVRGSQVWNATHSSMDMGATWRIANAIKKRGIVATVATPGVGVALSAAGTAAPYYVLDFTTTGATANITISGGGVGSEVLVCLAGNGINAASWSSDFHFLSTTSPQPTSGKLVYVLFQQHLDGDWYEMARTFNPLDFIDQVDENRIATGQETFPRETCDQNATAATSGVLELTYFTAYKTETSTQVKTFAGGIAAAATPTTCKVGLYTVASNGDLTRVAITANTTTLWATINTAYTTAWLASVDLVKGQRYALARLIVTGVAAPSWPCQFLAAALGSETPRINGQVAGQTDIPASISAGTVANTAVRRFAEVLP